MHDCQELVARRRPIAVDTHDCPYCVGGHPFPSDQQLRPAPDCGRTVNQGVIEIKDGEHQRGSFPCRRDPETSSTELARKRRCPNKRVTPGSSTWLSSSELRQANTALRRDRPEMLRPTLWKHNMLSSKTPPVGISTGSS